MASLFELVNNEKQLWDWLADDEKPEDAVLDAFEYNEENISAKLAGYAKVISNGEDEIAGMLAKAKAMQERVDALKKSAKTMQNKVDRMKQDAADAMKVMGVKKLENDGIKMSLRTYGDGSIDVTDVSEIPQQFLVQQDPKIDRKAIMAYCKQEGINEIPGAVRIAPAEKFTFKF